MNGQVAPRYRTVDGPEVSAGASLDKRSVAGLAVLAAVAVAGLFYVKWNPYFHRAFAAAAQHSIGASIVSGKTAMAPEPSLAAALGYAWAYGKAIWQAMVLGLVLGAGVQAVVPRDWLRRILGQLNFSGVAVAGLASVPSMM
jgi:uncharacterized membrane protein YraQ (UPF0718 family)